MGLNLQNLARLSTLLEGQHLQTLVWLQYIGYIVSFGPIVKRILMKFLGERNHFNQYIKFTNEYSAEKVLFLDLKVGLR